MSIDVHQHLWGPAFISALRSRTAPPRLDGWTLILDGEPDYEIDPADHDVAGRAALAIEDGLDRVLISLSSPLGIEWLEPAESRTLIEAYHSDAAALPSPFGTWAAACLTDIDADLLGKDLAAGFVGLQLPATELLDDAGYERCAPLLDELERRDLPLFVHPGAGPTPVRAPPTWPGAGGGAPHNAEPGWWAAVVPYVQQMHAAWFALRAYGRPRHPHLRVCFALLAGLAPIHGERLTARGGGRGTLDRDAFVETSSYGPRAVDAVTRALGIDVVVYGSDRPYAGAPEPDDFTLGAAARVALRHTNPCRLLAGEE